MSSIHALSDRIRHEFTELPGLKITMAQACRLWSADEALCGQALAALIDEGFLRQTPSGAFIALPRPGGRSAKAALSDAVAHTRCPHCHHLNTVRIERTPGPKLTSATFRCAACSHVVTMAALSA